MSPNRACLHFCAVNRGGNAIVLANSCDNGFCFDRAVDVKMQGDASLKPPLLVGQRLQHSSSSSTGALVIHSWCSAAAAFQRVKGRVNKPLTHCCTPMSTPNSHSSGVCFVSPEIKLISYRPVIDGVPELQKRQKPILDVWREAESLREQYTCVFSHVRQVKLRVQGTKNCRYAGSRQKTVGTRVHNRICGSTMLFTTATQRC